jgi:hypothetical protein
MYKGLWNFRGNTHRCNMESQGGFTKKVAIELAWAVCIGTLYMVEGEWEGISEKTAA